MRRVVHGLILASVFLMLGLSQTHAQPQGLGPIPETPEPPIIRNFPGLTPEQVKKIMEHSARIQDCLASEGKEPLQRLQKRSEENSKAIGALCQAGKYEEAQALAIEQAKAAADSEDMKLIEKCKTDAMALAKDLPMKAEAKTSSPMEQVPDNICGVAGK